MSALLQSRNAQALILGFVLGLATIGGWLKLQRYSVPSTIGEADIRQAVTVLAASDGWRPARLPADGRETFPWQAFAKAGCRDPLVVATLTSGRELHGLVKAIYGSDVALVGIANPGRTGSADALPPTWLGVPSAWLQLARPGKRVVLAVHPSPASSPDGCGGPSEAAWRNLHPTSRVGGEAIARLGGDIDSSFETPRKARP